RKRFGDVHLVVFYTLVDDAMRHKMVEYCSTNPYIVAVDLIGPAIDALAQVSGRVPIDVPGGLRIADADYFQRIEAMEFTIAHDDGRNPQDLTQADIVLLGVSRTSKTPTSIYLSQQGYKVANIPLDSQTEPPKELFDVAPSRVFGLVT
ncbi:kinase/pyrophosphorylase, partial [Escherichia coli]|nr:kinase/pyrophosphorylase [Escherichia coli]